MAVCSAVSVAGTIAEKSLHEQTQMGDTSAGLVIIEFAAIENAPKGNMFE